MIRAVALIAFAAGAGAAAPTWTKPIWPTIFDGTFQTSIGWQTTAQYFGYAVDISADGSIFAASAPGSNLITAGYINKGQIGALQPFSPDFTDPHDQLPEGPVAYTGSEGFTGSGSASSGGSRVTPNAGYSLSLSADGDLLAVSAHNSASGPSVALFTGLKSGSPRQTQRIMSPVSLDYACGVPSDDCQVFGERVSLAPSGKYIAISNPKINNYIGAVYVYELRKGVTYGAPITVLPPPLEPIVPLSFFEFGQSVKINSDGSRLFVGAPNYRFLGPTPFVGGAVYVYFKEGGSYVLKQRLQAPTPAAGDGAGYRGLSISEEPGKPKNIVLTFGNSRNDVGQQVSVYEGRGNGPFVLKAVINATHLTGLPGATDLAFGTAVHASAYGSKLFITGYADDSAQTWGYTTAGLFTTTGGRGAWTYTRASNWTNYGKGASSHIINNPTSGAPYPTSWNDVYGPPSSPISASADGKTFIAGCGRPGIYDNGDLLGSNAVTIGGW